MRPRRRPPVADPVWLTDHTQGVVVTCWVVPGASRSEVKGLHGEALKVRVAAPPEGGRANRELCRLLGDLCGLNAELLAGVTSREKQVLIRGGERNSVSRALAG